MEKSLYFKQVFKAIEVMGYDWYKGLVHAPYGLVSLARMYESSVIARYAVSLATAFNKFYNDCLIIREENVNVKEARLMIVDTVKKVLEDACGLLGLKCPKEM